MIVSCQSVVPHLVCYHSMQLTVIIDDVLDIAEDFSISLLSHACLLLHGLAMGLKDSCGLRVQYEWDG